MRKRHKTIMIIDDVEMVRETVAKMAERVGMHPVLVPHAGEFEVDWVADQVDIVLTDVFMPGKSGLDIIEELRESCPDLPVVAMSAGLNDEQHREDALRAAVKIGAYEKVLEKPFTAEAFEDMMRELELIP